MVLRCAQAVIQKELPALQMEVQALLIALIAQHVLEEKSSTLMARVKNAMPTRTQLRTEANAYLVQPTRPLVRPAALCWSVFAWQASQAPTESRARRA